MQKKLKYPIIFLFIYLLFPIPISEGCGIDEPFHGYSFYSPTVVNPYNDIAPYFLDIKEIYESHIQPQKAQKLGNLTEWRERYCEVPSINDLNDIIYKADIFTLQDIRDAIESKSLTLSYMGNGIAKNSFAKHLYKNKCVEAVNYLIFAKRCEEYVIKRRSWEDKKRNVRAMLQLIKKGKKEFIHTKSYYFKLRYAYQLVRLAHYAKKYELVLELYDFLMPKTDNDPSIIEDWIEGHRAGAMMKLGQRVEAAYIFSRIFERCPSKRESAFLSFSIKTDEEWKACLLMCKNEHEEAMLYVLRAQKKNSRIVEEMKSIYALDPTNENLAYLMVREIMKLEKDLLGYEFNDKRKENKKYYKIPRASAAKEVIELQAIAREISGNKNVKRSGFWKITEAYLELLSGDYYYAKKSLEEAQKMVKSDTLAHQLKTLELVLEVTLMEKMNSRTEERIYSIRNHNEIFKAYPDFNDFVRDKMAHLYREEGEEAKAFLCYNKLSAIRPYPKPEIVDNLMSICDKPDKTMTEKQMILKANGTTIKNDLLDMKANMFMSKFLPQKALEIYKEMPDETYWDGYGIYDPFIERINDCPSCSLSDTSITYNKGELFGKLLSMEQEAIVEPNPNKTAYIYYKLGLAYYNMTWFSYSWNVMDYTRDKKSLIYVMENGGNVIPKSGTPYGNIEYFDCSRALFYFEKALALSSSETLNAKATYMAGKCEHNMYLLQKDKSEGEGRYYYDLLNTDYRETKFYARVRNKSRDFQEYLEELEMGE